MARIKTSKQDLLTAIADHVLENGLNTASLRPMASAAGTSDRMLIYYFGNKERLIEELLEFLASRMAAGLDSAIPAERFASEKDLVKTVIALMRSEPFKPYIRVWLDIISAASQGSDAHRNAGQAIIDVYLDWLATRHPNDTEGAQFALTLIEGTLIMDALGQSATADAACERISS